MVVGGKETEDGWTGRKGKIQDATDARGHVLMTSFGYRKTYSNITSRLYYSFVSRSIPSVHFA